MLPSLMITLWFKSGKRSPISQNCWIEKKFFGPKNLEINGLNGVFKMKHSQVLRNYVGLPSSIGKNKAPIFTFIGERANARVRGWKSKFLNQVEKEVLLKSVVTTILSYAMSCFLIPKRSCNEINTIQRKFWWDSDESKKKINWIS